MSKSAFCAAITHALCASLQRCDFGCNIVWICIRGRLFQIPSIRLYSSSATGGCHKRNVDQKNPTHVQKATQNTQTQEEAISFVLKRRFGNNQRYVDEHCTFEIKQKEWIVTMVNTARTLELQFNSQEKISTRVHSGSRTYVIYPLQLRLPTLLSRVSV